MSPVSIPRYSNLKMSKSLEQRIAKDATDFANAAYHNRYNRYYQDELLNKMGFDYLAKQYGISLEQHPGFKETFYAIYAEYYPNLDEYPEFIAAFEAVYNQHYTRKWNSLQISGIVLSPPGDNKP